MIITKISGINQLLRPLTVITVSNYFVFCTLQQKAQKYLCAAVAYRTLVDVDPYELYRLKYNDD